MAGSSRSGCTACGRCSTVVVVTVVVGDDSEDDVGLVQAVRLLAVLPPLVCVAVEESSLPSVFVLFVALSVSCGDSCNSVGGSGAAEQISCVMYY